MVKETKKAKLDNKEYDPSMEKEGIKEIPIEDKIERPKKTSKKSRVTKDKQVAKINELESEVKNCEEKYLRLYSDFDNYRRRTAKERIELNKTASAEIIGSLLTVLDDFERAQKAMIDTDNTEAIK